MDTQALHAAALARFEVRPSRIELLARAVVRVEADDGELYALRCTPIAGRVWGDIPLELAWIEALRRDTDVYPVEPVGSAYEIEDHDCVLFHWIPGKDLADELTPDNVRALGVLSARLHEHAATFRPPAWLPVRRLENLIHRGERYVLGERDLEPFVPAERRGLYAAVEHRYQAAVDELYRDPAGLRVIHSDLQQENVKFLPDGRLRPFDFYESIWGYPLQDIALTFFDLTTFRDEFRAGYESRLPWPERHRGQIDTLLAGRHLRRANWVLANETATAPQDALLGFFDRLDDQLRALLDSAR